MNYMGRKKRLISKKEAIKPVRTSILDLKQSRIGGEIALSGFSYQFLYSCYLILLESDENSTFQLEGIEDIDHYKCEVTSKTSTHIQLKYSTQKQDASFLKDVLKNFLEAYLLDNSLKFKLVYDFTVAKGNLSKLFNNNLDKNSIKYWNAIIQNIKDENVHWNWTDFSFDSFIKNLSFENQGKNSLSEKIEKQLIEKYDITTGNITLFANGIEMCCLKKMERRESVNKKELDAIIQSIKDDISKGTQNPAHSWIKKLNFDISNCRKNLSYFEGKKATPQDIAMQLPVRRLNTENEIEQSIQNNRVTVIKASSGQGKTTMALQVAFNLRHEYTIYQLLWCNDSKELDNIIKYFKSRVKIGEKPLIIVDNLDSQLSEWNRLAQLLQEEISFHYKLLLTTREDDWYNYSGNLSNVRSLKVVKLSLNEQEAKSIFEVLQRAQKLHQSITDWRSSWEKVSDKKLLIEFVYLLTHGEMISERIAHQISQINNTDTGKIKCEILRIVCYADICGIKIPVSRLVRSLLEETKYDYGEILKSVENEFLIRVDTIGKYVEGLHPVRSQHIVDRLHEFVEISDTALLVVKLTDITYLPKLFSKLPQFVTNKKPFYSTVVEALWEQDDLSYYEMALQGLLSGSVMQYYRQNKTAFDDANEHGGLFLISTELNPFTRFEEFDYSLQTLDDLKRTNPDNTNIQYLSDLRDSMPKVVLSETDIYCFGEALFNKLKSKKLEELANDVSAYASIAYWLLNLDQKFNLSYNISLESIWEKKENYTIDTISSIMYTCFCGNKKVYTLFIEENLPNIITYLKMATKSLKMFLSEDGSEIHVEYILLPSNIRKGNEESVSRLKVICKTLPIFETYCANSVKPTLDILSGYNIPDDAHKAMPIRNLFIMFHKEFASLWSNTISSNYESDSIYEWLNIWFSIRKNIAVLLEKSFACICKFLESKPLGSLATEIDTLRTEINKELAREYRYPNQDRPFEEKPTIPDGFGMVKIDYFGGIQNFSNQFVGLLSRDPKQSWLALINLRTAHASLRSMHKFFEDITSEQGVLQLQHSELCKVEEQNLQNLIITCLFFKEHQPSKYFNKYQIKAWYYKNYEKELNDSKIALNGLSEEHSITYPEKYYFEGILKFYPIIVDNLDMTNSEILIKLLYLCTTITTFDYDYIVIASRNCKGQIMPNALRVSMQFLKDYQTAIDTENEELIQKLSLPLPVEISSQFLECFKQYEELFVPILSGYEGIDRIAELLWAFSKTQKELIDKEDFEYLTLIKNNLKTEILSLLKSFEYQIPNNDYCELFQLCNDTFRDSEFDNVKLNNFNNKLISKALELIR
jgi:hypothetical protein